MQVLVRERSFELCLRQESAARGGDVSSRAGIVGARGATYFVLRQTSQYRARSVQIILCTLSLPQICTAVERRRRSAGPGADCARVGGPYPALLVPDQARDRRLVEVGRGEPVGEAVVDERAEPDRAG